MRPSDRVELIGAYLLVFAVTLAACLCILACDSSSEPIVLDTAYVTE